MTADLRHYDPSPENKEPGQPVQKGRPVWPYILVIVVAAGLYFGAKPSDVARDRPSGPVEVVNDPLDSNGTAGITFTYDKQNHYFRNNDEAGNILIITGMVRNSYPERRDFIRLRGHLLTADGRTLADSYAYAGNIISESDLQDLPIREIYSRLSLKGGQDGRNINVEPGRELPFMLVFDKLPEGMAEYRVDPASSSPSRTSSDQARQAVFSRTEAAGPEPEEAAELQDLPDFFSDFEESPSNKSEDRIEPADPSSADKGLKP